MKKKILLFFVCLIAGYFSTNAQVSISTDGSAPDSSAMLDVKSTDRGFLLPRMRSEQILKIPNPATSLMVYCIDCEYFLIYNGSSWVSSKGDTLTFGISADFQGGKIFYITPENDAYIISGDLRSGMKWGCNGTLIGGTSSELGAGEGNTATIVASCADPDFAANYCQTLSYNGYSDWFLPSKNELSLAFQNLANENWSGSYWTSTEYNAYLAYKAGQSGFSLSNKLTSPGLVRCVRLTSGTNCTPECDPANAGVDFYNESDSSVLLNGSSPGTASGLWSIISGTGGVISDPHSPTSIFTGLRYQSYILRWTVTDSCGVTIDDVIIYTGCSPQPVLASAGPDQLNISGVSCTLAAETPVSGTGSWSVGGESGYIVSPSNPLSVFYGQKGQTYTLHWTVHTLCGSIWDQVVISFADDPCPPPTTSDAGGSKWVVGTMTYLDANAPTIGTGTWQIISGVGGELEDATDPATRFDGLPSHSYTLKWTITNCNVSSVSYAQINFRCEPAPNLADAGPDQLNVSGTSTYVQADWSIYWEDQVNWSIVSGEGGSLYSVPPDFYPHYQRFDGQKGTTYLLKWEVANCSSNCDFVTISFLCDITPTSANAGPSQMNVPGTYTVLQGNTPTEGTGKWSVVGNATGAIFTDDTSPTSGFTGAPGINYTLRWTITSSCGLFSSDDMYLSFACIPVTANAGPDQLNLASVTTYLQGNTPSAGTYSWSIISGTGGYINSPTNPNSLFQGISGNSNTLRWTVNTTSCGIVYDDVNISFQCAPQPTQANAGPDQLNLTTLSTNLQANNPTSGTGQWSIISGTGGVITDINNPTSVFTGVEGQTYDLRWSITACNTSQDDVTISITCPTSNAGPDQLNIAGTSTTLAGNTPWVGSGQWVLIGGSGGTITDPYNPQSTFTGIPGPTYILRWYVTSNCTTVSDDVHISFVCSPQPSQANAGADQSNIAGVTTTLQGNTPVYGTGTWTVASGANGIIAQPNNPTTTFTGTNGTTYILLWTISNSCGSTNDNVSISFAAFSCGNTFQDTRDGHVYTTLTRGAQCWMKQNLNYATGSSVCYSGNQSNCDNYGRLYDWNTANTACPTNWHLPTDAQWCTLLTGIDGTVNCSATGMTGTNAGGNMKETGTTYWAAPNTGATNSSGFSARGGGSTTIPGRNLTQWGSFWTASTNGSNYWSWEMTYNDARVWHTYYGWTNTMSVRCLKN
jgi:uncharacterized protein (TIGR02145 family)